jgi:hypothetical protein
MKNVDWSYIVVGFFTTAFGPTVGPFAMLLFASVIGALLPMSKEGEMTRLEGAVYIAICVGVSLSLTGLCVWLVQNFTTVPGNIVFMPLAFLLAAGRPFILSFVGRVFDGAAAGLEAIFTRGGAK